VNLDRLLVKDWMMPRPLTVSPDTGLLHAFRLMKAKGIRQLPVVQDGQLVGILTDRDLRRPEFADDIDSWDQLYRISDLYQVAEIMKAEVTTIQADASLRDAARLLQEYGYSGLPVLSESKALIGILSTRDILRALV
jgi:acetoin utilization protein AcuB